jgi:hypothetical protein
LGQNTTFRLFFINLVQVLEVNIRCIWLGEVLTVADTR